DQRVALLAEYDGFPIRRPVEARDGELPGREARRLDDGIGADVEHPQVREPILGVLNGVLAELLDAVLLFLRDRIRRGERDARAVGRPLEIRDAFLEVGERLRFAPRGTRQVDLPLRASIGEEGDRLAVRRPPRGIAALLLGPRQLERRLVLPRKPELGVVSV